MEEFISPDNYEGSDCYLEQSLRQEAKREAEKFEDQYRKKILEEQKKFISSNQQMFDFLSDNFGGHPNLISLLQAIIMKVIEQYPILSANRFADLYSSLFTYNDMKLFTTDLHKYMLRKLKFWSMKNRSGSKDWLTLDEFEGLYSHDLATYLACLIYNKLKSYESFPNLLDYNLYKNPFNEAFEFFPISTTKIALEREFWFKGHVDRMFMIKSKKGYKFAKIFIKDKNWNEFLAIVRTKHYFKLLDGLKKMKNSVCDIAIHGKIIYDKYNDEVILDADRFSLEINGTHWNYRS